MALPVEKLYSTSQFQLKINVPNIDFKAEQIRSDTELVRVNIRTAVLLRGYQETP